MGREVPRIGQRTNTEKVRYSQPSERFTPGWGNSPGAPETMKALRQRIDEGQKMTPIGRGVAIKK